MKNPTMLDDLVTVREAAGLLRCDEESLRRWIRRGYVPAIRLARKDLRLRRSDLERFVAEGAERRHAFWDTRTLNQRKRAAAQAAEKATT